MHDQSWLKYGAIALGTIGFVFIIGFAMSIGQSLEGPTWAVHEMSVDGTMTTPIPETPPFAVFEDGTVAGSSGCNDYTGSYEASDGSMVFGPLATTRKACITPLMGQETVYFELLAQVDSYEVKGDELTLSSGDTVLIRYGN